MCRNGYTQHGDYVFGWEDDSLQRAMDARCNGAVCGVLKTQSSEEAMKCTKQRVVEEDIDGCKLHLLTVYLARLSPTDYLTGVTEIPGQVLSK